MKFVTMVGIYLTLIGSVNASVALGNNTKGWDTWSSVGQAQLTMFFFDVYQSQLFSPDGGYLIDEDITPHPLALSITYQRDISQKQLLDATVEQWEMLGYEQSLTSQWERRLGTIFPDIKEGSNLTYVTDGFQGKFYYSQAGDVVELIGHIEEEDFNDAFLAIWLSPETEFPTLRKNLIGRY
ncbi:chalcone isomerase family protein [Vibrio hepatarius]|uniref:chalcone isomerase family protein n=1 Tax=Vibrio hepatarius TaxID=171383 RepID=UPI001C08DEB3|nr:chalcone isomerase family protein [Vibrio hepatarius]MBU2897858.1 chalcone isomerase family protein [Vibrio hepatarius]